MDNNDLLDITVTTVMRRGAALMLGTKLGTLAMEYREHYRSLPEGDERNFYASLVASAQMLSDRMVEYGLWEK